MNSTRQLLGWLTSITQPVHKPLYISICFRILSLSLDIFFFGIAAWGVVVVIAGDYPIIPVISMLVLIALTKAISYYLEQLTGHYVAFKALELLRTMVFSKLWPKAPAIITYSRSGDVLASLTRDVDRIEVVYAHTLAPLVSAFVVPITFLLFTGMLVGWSVVLVTALCIVLALLAVPFFGFQRSMTTTRQTLRLRRDLVHHVTDSVFGVEEIIGYGRQNERLAQMDELGEAIAASSFTARSRGALRRAANVVLMLLGVIGMAHGAIAADLSMALTAGLTAGAMRLFEGPRGIEDAANYLDHSFAAARRLWEISNSPQTVFDGPKTYEARNAPSIEFFGISYAYASGSFALRDVDIAVPAGGHVVLIGPSGSGKTTTIDMLLRYDDPSVGQVLLDGVPIRDYTLDSLRRAVVLVSQKNQLLDATIRENVTLGAPDATDEEIWRAMEVACLADEVRAMPSGMETPVGLAGGRLSGGQVQRLCLARALLMRPRVLVLDEFTANLNVALEASIRQNLADHASEMTILEVTHRLDLATTADRIYLMDRGRIIASGTPAEIEASEGNLGEFFRRNV